MASEHQQAQQREQEIEQLKDRPLTGKPEVTEEHKEKAREMRKEYDEDRPTVALPGSDNTVTGTAINEWLDDDGNPKFGDQSKGATDGGDSKGGSIGDAKEAARRS